ncbi:MAG TPA: hypothetical protein DER09_07270 [Prolixibacteraceae bacterium]|nr:hypothetical protein [Prolixibacteraceae bacterium]
MKKNLFLLTILALVIFSLHAEEKVKFYMANKIECDSSTNTIAYEKRNILEDVVGKKLQDNYPCISLSTQTGVHIRLDALRKQCYLKDVPTDDIQKQLSSIGSALDCNYLVYTYIKVFPDKKAMVTCKVMDYKKAQVIASSLLSQNISSISNSVAEKMAEEMMDQLKDHEICPYEGKLTIEIESEKEESTSSSAVCDNGIITTQIKLNSKSTGKWELNKNGLRKAGGSVSYDLNEKTETTIINPCYVCPDGTKTMAQIQETKTVEGKVSGLSSKSVFEGQNVEDCRVKIMFLSDETYYILVKAVTEKGNLKTTIDKKVNAPCATGDEEKPEEPRNNEIDIPLVVVLGPYKGTTKDAVLSQNETKDLTQGQEKGTAKINFSLTRKN